MPGYEILCVVLCYAVLRYAMLWCCAMLCVVVSCMLTYDTRKAMVTAQSTRVLHDSPIRNVYLCWAYSSYFYQRHTLVGSQANIARTYITKNATIWIQFDSSFQGARFQQ
jgi:hypothetical protein